MRLNLDNFGDDYEQYRERSVRAKTNDNQRLTSELIITLGAVH